MRSNKIFKIALRDAFITSLTILLISVITGYVVYYSADEGLKKEVQQNLLNIAKSVAELVDGDSHQLITQPEDKDNDRYKTDRWYATGNTNIC